MYLFMSGEHCENQQTGFGARTNVSAVRPVAD
jgi:hypothetical protein